jgi:hypothetical protein
MSNPNNIPPFMTTPTFALRDILRTCAIPGPEADPRPHQQGQAQAGNPNGAAMASLSTIIRGVLDVLDDEDMGEWEEEEQASWAVMGTVPASAHNAAQ